MSHMDPVSGTDIDLFIEGMIPCSLHLEDQAEAERDKKKKSLKLIQQSNVITKPMSPPVNELE